MKNTLSRVVAPALAILTFSAAGIALAQSGSSPSGTPAPANQPGSESKPNGAAEARVATAPTLIALALYADWCPACKTLKPKMEEAMKSVAGQPMLLVKLDQSEKDSHQAEYMAAALGLGDLWKDHGGKTGYVLLVDASTKKVVGNISFRFEPKEIVDAVMSAVKAATR